MLIGETVNKQTKTVNRKETLKVTTGRRMSKQGMEDLNSGPLKTNPTSGREVDLNTGPPDYKFSIPTISNATSKGRIHRALCSAI